MNILKKLQRNEDLHVNQAANQKYHSHKREALLRFQSLAYYMVINTFLTHPKFKLSIRRAVRQLV